MFDSGKTALSVVGIDIGKNSFHVVGLDRRGAIVLRQRWSRIELLDLSLDLAISQHARRSPHRTNVGPRFPPLVGAGEHGGWDGKAERLWWS